METNNTSTASAQEIARFTAMADAWWDPNGKFKPLHQINPLRIEYIRNLICQHHDRDPKGTKPLNKIKLLDIGCGGGLLCEPMQRLGATVTGIDAGKKNIAIASLHAKQSGLKINYCHQLPEDLTKTKDTFDVVLNMEVIEHVKNVDTFLKSSVSLVKPGGLMVLSTINRTMKSLILAKIGAEYILRWLPIGTHEWNKFLTPEELTNFGRKNSLLVEKIDGMVFNPLSNRWKVSQDCAVNYIIKFKKN